MLQEKNHDDGFLTNIVLYRRNHEGWNLTLVVRTRRQSLLWSDMDKKSKLARQLYPSLPNWEIALLSGTWAFSIAYALSRVLLLSRSKSANCIRQLWFLELCKFERNNFFFYSLEHYAYFAEYELVPDWLGNGVWRRDTSDHEWEVFSSHLFVALPWMVLQLVGTQILKKYNHQVRHI